MPHVHGPGFPMPLGSDALGIDEHQRTCRWPNRGRLAPLPAAFAGPSEQECRWRLRPRQRQLPLQGRLQLVSESQPLLRGSGFEIAEGTDRALSWTFGSKYRFNEQVVGVAFAFVDPFSFADIHWLSDFTEGTHPISTKWTTQFSGAKRRSDLELFTLSLLLFSTLFFCL